jgi:hypothetical protein
MELKNKKVFKKTTISGSKRRDSLKDNTKADRDVMSDGSPAYMDDLDLYSHRMQ